MNRQEIHNMIDQLPENEVEYVHNLIKNILVKKPSDKVKRRIALAEKIKANTPTDKQPLLDVLKRIEEDREDWV